MIKTNVYQLTVEVLGNDQNRVSGAYVIVYAESGVGCGLSNSNETGHAVFKLPKGTYDIEAHYSGEYWLRAFATTANETGINVGESSLRSITLAEFPPPIWTTTGFWLLFIPILVTIVLLSTEWSGFLEACGQRKRYSLIILPLTFG